MNDKLNNYENDLREFTRLTIGVMSEVRSPLNAVLGYAKLLLMEHNGEIEAESIDRAEALQAIINAAEYITNCIGDLYVAQSTLTLSVDNENE